MPKKKLTKAQVKKTLERIDDLTTRLILDKVEQRDSFVKMSLPKLLEKQWARALLRRLK